jgi:hypothetical protein
MVFATQRWVPSVARADGRLKPHPITFEVGSDGEIKEWVACVFANTPLKDDEVSPAAPEKVVPEVENAAAREFGALLEANAGVGVRLVVVKETKMAKAGSTNTGRKRIPSPYNL